MKFLVTTDKFHSNCITTVVWVNMNTKAPVTQTLKTVANFPSAQRSVIHGYPDKPTHVNTRLRNAYRYQFYTYFETILNAVHFSVRTMQLCCTGKTNYTLNKQQYCIRVIKGNVQFCLTQYAPAVDEQHDTWLCAAVKHRTQDNDAVSMLCRCALNFTLT
jgi:hypothetical protein